MRLAAYAGTRYALALVAEQHALQDARARAGKAALVVAARSGGPSR